MLRIAQDVGDGVQEGQALFQLSQTYLWDHHFDEARDYAERARRLALKTGDPMALAGSLNMIAVVAQVTGDLGTARTAVEEAEQVARQADLPVLLAQALWYSGMQSYWRGDYGRALAQYDEGLQIARQHQAPDLLLSLLWQEALVHCGRGEYEQAVHYLQEDLELSARLGDRIWRPRALNLLGWVYLDLCHWELALHYNGQSAAEARILDDPEIIRNAELNLGDCYLAMDRLDEAQSTLESVEEECMRGGARGEEWARWRYTQHLNASLGELWLARGDAEKAVTFADKCLGAAEATDSLRNIVKGRRVKGEAFLAQGRLDAAETELEEALRVAREVGNPAQIWKTLASLGRLRRAQGRREEAAGAYREALATVEGVAAGLSDPGLRETLLASPLVVSLREGARTV
jgi:tetratricopeptide (TPR) repeat protein